MDVLIFTGGESPSPESLALFFEAMFRPDYIIAADSGLDTLVRYASFFGPSFAPDLILGDMDSLEDSSLLARYGAAKRESFPCDKDFSDSELALMRAREVAGEGRVALLGGSGGRADHFIALYDSFSRTYHADIWLCQNQTVVYLPQGHTLKVSHLAQDDTLSAARLTSEYSSSALKAQGLEWTGFATCGMASLSNRISREAFCSGQPVTLFAERGSFLIFLPQSALFCIKDDVGF